MFLTGQAQLSPFYTAGQGALGDTWNAIKGAPGTVGGTLNNLLTPGQSAAALSTMPGFQFASQYGTMAATNALAARGLAGGPGVVGRAVSDYNNGLAGQQYFNTVGALQNAYGAQTGAMQNYVNTGANAAGSLLGGAISSGNAMASTQQNIGNALASGIVGTGNAISGGLTGSANALALGGLYGKGGNSFLPSSSFLNNSWGW